MALLACKYCRKARKKQFECSNNKIKLPFFLSFAKKMNTNTMEMLKK